MIILQKVFVLEANAIGMNIAKNQQNSFWIQQKKHSSKHNKKLIVDDQKITDQTHILEYIREFYETLFKKRKQKTAEEIANFLRHLNIPKLPENKSKPCEEDLTEKDLYDSLKIMQIDKSPGNDRLTKEFCETFWN